MQKRFDLNINKILEKPEIIFVILAFIFGCIFLFKTPPFEVPDEAHHLLRTCEIADLAGDIEIRLTSHLTNLNNLNETAVGKTFTLSVAAVDFNVETFEYKTISEEIFSYTLTEEDVKNQSVPGVPAYSKDFSNGYMSFNLNGDGANRILITMKSKIEFTANEKKAGVNYSVHSLQILR